MEPLILPSIPVCPAPAPSCEPVSCDPMSLARAIDGLCRRLNSMEGALNAAIRDIPADSMTSINVRRLNASESDIRRLKANALTCLSWNAETCQIQGGTLDGLTKIFASDPCVDSLSTRVASLEGAIASSGNITDLGNRVSAIEVGMGNLVSTVSAGDDFSLAIETQNGTVTSVGLAGLVPPVTTLLQETNVAGPADTELIIPFIVAHDSAVEIIALFQAQTATHVYNLQVRNDVPAVVQTFDSATTGVMIDSGDLHQARIAECHLAPGNYNVRFTKAGGGALNSLSVSLQIKSMP